MRGIEVISSHCYSLSLNSPRPYIWGRREYYTCTLGSLARWRVIDLFVVWVPVKAQIAGIRVQVLILLTGQGEVPLFVLN
jgi:hypothetical protein